MGAKLNLVTGATGLLGSHIVENLIQRGDRVRALVRPQSDTHFLQELGVELAFGDLQDRASIERAAEGVDIVYHSAARVGDWGPWSAFKAQVIDGTANLVDACRTAGIGRLLHVSSIGVYGRPKKKLVITEDEPFGQRLRWLDHYCRAKIQAEAIVRDFGPNATIVRPSWIYGPRDRNGLPRLVMALRLRWISILGSGDNVLNVVHAADVAEGAVRAANDPMACGQAYHLCREEGATQREFFDTFCKELRLPPITRHLGPSLASLGGRLADIVARVGGWKRPPYVSRYSIGLLLRPNNYSIAKAWKHLGWEPRIHAAEGIHQALEWFRQTGARADKQFNSASLMEITKQ